MGGVDALLEGRKDPRQVRGSHLSKVAWVPDGRAGQTGKRGQGCQAGSRMDQLRILKPQPHKANWERGMEPAGIRKGSLKKMAQASANECRAAAHVGEGLVIRAGAALGGRSGRRQSTERGGETAHG